MGCGPVESLDLARLKVAICCGTVGGEMECSK